MHATSKRNQIFNIPERWTQELTSQREETIIWRRETLRRYHRNRKRLERNRPFIGLLGNASYEMVHGSKTQGRKVLNSWRGGADIISISTACRHTASLYSMYCWPPLSSICCWLVAWVNNGDKICLIILQIIEWVFDTGAGQQVLGMDRQDFINYYYH